LKNKAPATAHMITPEQIDLFKQYVQSAQRVLILFPVNATFDQVASSTALYLGLREIGKDVSLLTPELVRTEFASLVGIQDATQNLGNKNLQVSFDYKEEMVDKVSYNIDEEHQKFHLVIQPKRSGMPLDAKTVEFSYTGADADVIFLIGVHSLESLEQLYIGYEDFYVNTPTVSVNSFETSFGSIKLTTEGSASFSEVMAYLLQEAGVQIDSDIATNLLGGIEEATDSFKSLAATADTFEIVSRLMRSGARRISRAKPSAQANGFAEAFARSTKTAAVSGSANGSKSKPKINSKMIRPPGGGGGEGLG
jgi:hypothetical protein